MKILIIRCSKCIHKEVCKYRPPKEYPNFMKEVIADSCIHFMPYNKVENPQEVKAGK